MIAVQEVVLTIPYEIILLTSLSVSYCTCPAQLHVCMLCTCPASCTVPCPTVLCDMYMSCPTALSRVLLCDMYMSCPTSLSRVLLCALSCVLLCSVSMSCPTAVSYSDMYMSHCPVSYSVICKPLPIFLWKFRYLIF